jgi:hypothetical protein
VRDLAERRIAHLQNWQRKVRPVQRVEHLGPQLPATSAAEPDGFDEPQIEVHIAWAANDVAACVAGQECTRCARGSGECGGVEPTLDGALG